MSNAPVWQQFVTRIATKAALLGVTSEEKKGWIVFTGPNGHRLALQKSATKLPRIECTLDLPASCEQVVEEIRLNGRMRCALIPTPEVVVAAFELMTDASNPIPAPKRGGKSAEAPALDDLLASPPPPVTEDVTAEQAAESAEL